MVPVDWSDMQVQSAVDPSTLGALRLDDYGNY